MSQNPMGNFEQLSTTAAKSITTTTSVRKCTPKEAHKKTWHVSDREFVLGEKKVT